jgi:hypothetical protein
MAKLTPQQAQEKHARRLKGSTEDIRQGIQRVTEAPGIKAAKKTDKMRTNLLNAIDSGKWTARVQSVSLESWKTLMADKGIPRIAAGIDGAKEKTTEFFAQLFPYQDSLSSKVNSMPDITLEDNLQRMTTFVRGMSQFKRK